MHNIVKIAEGKGIPLVQLAWRSKIPVESLKAIIRGDMNLPELWSARLAGILGCLPEELTMKRPAKKNS